MSLPPVADRGRYPGAGRFSRPPLRRPHRGAWRALPGLAITCTIKVSSEPVSRWLMLAYDDEFSIKYFRRNLRPYWRRQGDDAATLLKKAAADYESLAHDVALLSTSS